MTAQQLRQDTIHPFHVLSRHPQLWATVSAPSYHLRPSVGAGMVCCGGSRAIHCVCKCLEAWYEVGAGYDSTPVAPVHYSLLSCGLLSTSDAADEVVSVILCVQLIVIIMSRYGVHTGKPTNPYCLRVLACVS